MNQKSGGFDASASVWDLFSPPGPRLTREGPFLDSWARGGQTFLELACGIGAHAHHLAKGGPGDRQVTATDLSPQMIEEARRRHPHPNLVFQVGDMLSPPPGPFDRIMILGNSLNLVPHRDLLNTFWPGIYRSLTAGGSFLIQILNPLAFHPGEPRVQVSNRVREGENWVLVKSFAPSMGAPRCYLTLSAFPEERPWEPLFDTAVLLNLFPGELEAGAREAGFTEVKWFGGMDGSAWDPNASKDAVGLFSKPT